MTESQQLLVEYQRNGSEAAFRELVSRYLGLVYGTASRILGDQAHLAQDVAQMVFSDFARQARKLPAETLIGGWLHRHACFVAARTLRGERRRKRRERTAVELNELSTDTNPNVAALTPILDEAINQLGREDRWAVVQRYFEQRDFKVIGTALGGNEDAARMRVNRALEKLQVVLKRRGVASTTSAVAAALTAQSGSAVPAGLTAGIASAALANASLPVAGTVITWMKIMALSKTKIAVSTLLLAGVVSSFLSQKQTAARLLAENSRLREQLSALSSDRDRLSSQMREIRRTGNSRSAATGLTFAPVPRSRGETGGAYLMDLMNHPPQVGVEQLQSYLDAHKTNVTSLLAAFRVTHDPELLARALREFPESPEAAFEALRSRDASPEERRRWLEAFKRGAPNNALANYLSAGDYARAGDYDGALREVMAAAGKSQFQDYTVRRIQDDNEAYLEAGFTPSEAKQLASSQETLPQLAPLKELGEHLVSLAESYRQSGDGDSAQDVLTMVAGMGRRYSIPSAGEPEISQLVGLVLERKALEQMEPGAAYGSDGQTVQQRIEQMREQEKALRALGKQAATLYPIMSEADMTIYKDRWMSLGEEAALRWVVGKYGSK
jgi:RNA polymerase sigma factor (sigma-70 family)